MERLAVFYNKKFNCFRKRSDTLLKLALQELVWCFGKTIVLVSHST